MSDSEGEAVFESADEGEEDSESHDIKEPQLIGCQVRASVTNVPSNDKNTQINELDTVQTVLSPEENIFSNSSLQNSDLESDELKNVHNTLSSQQSEKNLSSEKVTEFKQSDNISKSSQQIEHDEAKSTQNDSPITLSSHESKEKKTVQADYQSQDSITVSNKVLQESMPPEEVSIDRETPNLNSQPPSNSVSELFDTLSVTTKKDSKSGQNYESSWRGWGSSLLSSATSSVSTFTSSVGEGFSTVIESVESSLLIPSPEELAKEEIETVSDKTIVCDESAKDDNLLAADEPVKSSSEEPTWANWVPTVSNLTDVMHKTSEKLVTGGLDVLETIGKKTFDVIAESEHGIKNTFQKTPANSLSQVLRDAKNEADLLEKENENQKEALQSHFGYMFDEFQGLVHLEALEMLSTQCESCVDKLLDSLSIESLKVAKGELSKIRQHFDVSTLTEFADQTGQNFVNLTNEYVGSLGITTTPDKISRLHEEIYNQIEKQFEVNTSIIELALLHQSAKETHKLGIQSLANLSSKSIELFHKCGQQILLDKKSQYTAYKTKAKSIANLTQVLCSEFNILAEKLSDCLSSFTIPDNEETADTLITDIFLEATNSSTYIKDAFLLLHPVIQQSFIQALLFENDS